MSNGDSVSYTIKELIAMLERSLTDQVDSIQKKLDLIASKLEDKADRVKVHALESRVAALELVALRVGGPIDLAVQRHSEKIRVLELQDAGRNALSAWQRWFFGVVCIGLIGAIATIIWLATS